jgi:hypothetical protein
MGQVVDLRFKVVPSSLKAGAYTIACTVKNTSSGVVLNTTHHNLTRVDDSAPTPTAWLDDNHRLIYKNKPFFPLGLYLMDVNANSALQLIGASKFNTIMPYQAPHNITVMDRIDAAGLKVLYSTKDTYFGGPNSYPSKITSRAAEEPFVKQTVAKYKDHPALLGWYLNDELGVDWMDDLHGACAAPWILSPNP